MNKRVTVLFDGDTYLPYTLISKVRLISIPRIEGAYKLVVDCYKNSLKYHWSRHTTIRLRDDETDTNDSYSLGDRWSRLVEECGIDTCQAFDQYDGKGQHVRLYIPTRLFLPGS